jgi:hypothetical protein
VKQRGGKGDGQCGESDLHMSLAEQR